MPLGIQNIFFFFQVFKSLSMCTKFRFNSSSLSKKGGKEGALPPSSHVLPRTIKKI